MDVLLTILAVLAAMLLVAVVLTLVALALGLRQLKRRNRVSPAQPSPAPLTWLGSPAQTARLHRRLRSAVAVVRMVAARHATDGDASPVRHIAAQIEAQAVGLDEHLAVVSRLPAGERRRLSAVLAADVKQIEQHASRLSLLEADAAAPARLPHHPTAIQDLADQLDRLESARRVVAKVEADAGLTSPSPLPARSSGDDAHLRRGEG